jgi:hypothetical protein
MNDIKDIQDKHTAGAQAIAFDYQFYYFMYLALELRHGDKVGFEVKDDVHIDRKDGITVLFQAKHTIQNKSDGTPQNLATLDVDLWKTLSIWADMIKADESILQNHCFYLVTNKGEENNEFIESQTLFKTDNDVDKVIELLKELRNKTQNKNVENCIKNVLAIGKKKIRLFFSKLTIEASFDDIIGKIKNQIYENCRNKDLVDDIFESLSSNMTMAKYLDIKDRQKFEITFDDFNNRFGKCFRIAFEKKPLPKRNYPIKLPGNLEEQIFVKQLLDIGEIVSGAPQIINYTTQMLQVMNHLANWTENNIVLPTELDEFQREAILKWHNEFRAKYRQIERQINTGASIEDLETDIQSLGLQMIDFLRKENLSIAGDTLGIELSNGHYYSLSDKPEIGWHYDWERKYKSI